MNTTTRNDEGATMIIDEKKGFPPANNGAEVTADMVSSWDEAYSEGRLPDGYSYEGHARSGRPKLVDGEMTTLTIRIPLVQKEALARDAAKRGMSVSCYARELLACR